MSTERNETGVDKPEPRRRGSTSRRVGRAFVVALVLILSLASARPAAASCLPPGPLAERIAEAPSVFVGTVVSTTNRDRVAEVRVEEVWKGPALPEQAEVRGTYVAAGENAATSVDRAFRTGGRYLFVPDRAGASRSDGVPVFQDGLCSSTQEYHPGLDGLRPASTTAAPDRPASGGASGDGADVSALPLAAALAAAVAGAVMIAVAVRVRPAWSLRRG